MGSDGSPPFKSAKTGASKFVIVARGSDMVAPVCRMGARTHTTISTRDFMVKNDAIHELGDPTTADESTSW